MAGWTGELTKSATQFRHVHHVDQATGGFEAS